MSLRVRLLAVLTGLAALGLVVAGFATHAALSSFLVDRVDRTLTSGGETLERSLRFHGEPERGDIEDLTTQAPGLFIEIRTNGVAVVSGSLGGEGAPDLPERLPGGDHRGAVYMTVDGTGTKHDFRVRIDEYERGEVLILAAPLDDVDATLRRLTVIEVLVGLAILAALIVSGTVLIRIALRPLTRIEDTATAIAGGDLSQRVPEAPQRTEVGRLARALNAMLGHIEQAFAEREASERRLRQFVADASHELRTPLSAVRAYAELFGRGARDRPEDLARAMSGIERESARMGVLVDDLLLLARLDQGRPLERRPVDLAAVATEATDVARAVDPGRAITLDAPAPVEVTGDPHRLRQVVDNLLANVRAHTPPGTPATVRVATEDGRAVIEVADRGPGLGPDGAAHVFERFYRADPARARDRGGSGLGLAIVLAIARAHGGDATAESPPEGGARFTVRLPLGGPAPA